METVVGKGGSMTISRQQYPREIVKSRYLKLNVSHVEYVMECLRKNTTKAYNIKAFFLAALFNARTTKSNYYRAEVNHDMPQFAGKNYITRSVWDGKLQLVAKIFPKNEVWHWVLHRKAVKYVIHDNYVA